MLLLKQKNPRPLTRICLVTLFNPRKTLFFCTKSVQLGIQKVFYLGKANIRQGLLFKAAQRGPMDMQHRAFQTLPV